MKAFEKWWKNPDNQFYLVDYVGEDLAEVTWRAALTFAIERSKYVKTFGHLQSELVDELGDE